MVGHVLFGTILLNVAVFVLMWVALPTRLQSGERAPEASRVFASVMVVITLDCLVFGAVLIAAALR